MGWNYKRAQWSQSFQVTLTGMTAPSLRLRGLNYVLTYPHCSIAPATLVNLLKEKLQEFEPVYIIGCLESHHTSDALHNHAFFRVRRCPGRVEKSFFDIGDRHPNIQPARDYKASITYVKKDGNWTEFGTNPVKERATATKERNAKILREGVLACIEDGTIPLQSVQRTIAGINAAKMLAQRPRNPPRVFWFYGRTGSGKTRRAVELCPDYWMSGDGLKWFDGYTGQSCAILDDLRTNSCSMNYLLRLLDRYKLFVQIKGGFADWCPEVIVITCPVAPRDLYVNRETGEAWDHVDQVERRITEMRNFDDEPYGSRPEDGTPLPGYGPETGAERVEVWSAIERAPTPALPEDGEVPMEIEPEEIPSYALPVVEVPFTPVLDRWTQEDGPVKPVAVLAPED